MSADIKHKPIIDPTWPPVFRDPEFWKAGSFVGQRQQSLFCAQPAPVSRDQLVGLARSMSLGMTVDEAATDCGLNVWTARKRVTQEGGREAFLLKYAGGEP